MLSCLERHKKEVDKKELKILTLFIYFPVYSYTISPIIKWLCARLSCINAVLVMNKYIPNFLPNQILWFYHSYKHDPIKTDIIRYYLLPNTTAVKLSPKYEYATVKKLVGPLYISMQSNFCLQMCYNSFSNIIIKLHWQHGVPWLSLSLYIYIYIYLTHTHTCHSSLSSIAPGKSFRLHPASAQSWYM